jgi:hypothetical protein
MLCQNVFQCAGAAAVGTHDRRSGIFRHLERAIHHLVRHRAGKKDQKIGAANLRFQICGLLRKYLSFAVELLTYVFVGTDHAVMSSNNDNAHTFLPSFLF